MWSHFDEAKTSHAAAFITDCKRYARYNGMPVNTALHCSSPIAVAPDTTPVTGRQSYTERRMPRSRRNTAKQADVVFMT